MTLKDVHKQHLMSSPRDRPGRLWGKVGMGRSADKSQPEEDSAVSSEHETDSGDMKNQSFGHFWKCSRHYVWHYVHKTFERWSIKPFLTATKNRHGLEG